MASVVMVLLSGKSGDVCGNREMPFGRNVSGNQAIFICAIIPMALWSIMWQWYG